MGRFLKLLALFILLTGCSSASDSNVIHRYEYSDVRDKQISYLDVFNYGKEKYYIYYYQVHCYHCHGIKTKVISYALNSIDPFYFVEVDKDYGFISHTKEETIGSSNPYQAFALMTPQLSIVIGGVIKDTYIGEEEILNIIE